MFTPKCHKKPIVSLLPWGRFRHGPRRPPLLIVTAGGGQHLPSPTTASPQHLHGLIPYLLVSPPSHRKESHTKTEGIKLLKYALQIFWRVKIAYKYAYCTKFYKKGVWGIKFLPVNTALCVSKILTDICFYVKDIPHSTCTMWEQSNQKMVSVRSSTIRRDFKGF